MDDLEPALGKEFFFEEELFEMKELAGLETELN
jgi:hypothetical protein